MFDPSRSNTTHESQKYFLNGHYQYQRDMCEYAKHIVTMFEYGYSCIGYCRINNAETYIPKSRFMMNEQTTKIMIIQTIKFHLFRNLLFIHSHNLHLALKSTGRKDRCIENARTRTGGRSNICCSVQLNNCTKDLIALEQLN